LRLLVNGGFTYLSKIENGRLDFGDFPSEALIRRFADALDADEDELLLLAEKIPQKMKTMVLKRPDVFRKLADLDGRNWIKFYGRWAAPDRAKRDFYERTRVFRQKCHLPDNSGLRAKPGAVLFEMKVTGTARCVDR
jgi:transcriptional regulator with XRE-family HTH domain